MNRVLITFITFLFSVLYVFAQLGGPCGSYNSYNSLLNRNTNWKIDEDVYVKGYGDDENLALVDAKKKLMGKYFQETYLDNALTYQIISEFAPEVIKTKEPYIHRSKGKDKKKGKYTCELDIQKHNDAAVYYIEDQLKTLINNPVVFIINPIIQSNGDDMTKSLYNEALTKWRTAMLDVKYRFNNVLNLRMLQLANLPTYETNYSPCRDGFKYFKTGQKYKDFATSILANANTSQQVNIIFALDSIKYYEGDNKVEFHLVAFDVNTYQYLMEYDIDYTAKDATSPYDAVKLAINSDIFRDTVDSYMGQFVTRYASYIRDGIKFSLKICNNVLNQTKQFALLQAFSNCYNIYTGISQSDWRLKGAKIGSIFSGRILVIDPAKQQIAIQKLLLNNGVSLEDHAINKMGSDYTVTAKQ